jgi:hypothetical protein
MGTRRRLALLALAVALAVLVIAVPAQAATVASGSSQMTVSPAVTHTMHTLGVTVDVVSPATITTKWNSAGAMYWWIRVPMTSAKPGSWNPSSGVGTFFHSGSFRFINTATSPQKVFRAEGLQLIATNRNSYSLSVTYPAAAFVNLPAANYQRVTLATSTHAPKITNNGKSYKIDGVQFKLTAAGEAAIYSVIGVHLPTNVVLLDTDILPVLK